MASFINYATLSYNGLSVNSNVVTGELVENITAAKTAVTDEYSANDTLTYAVSITNTGSVEMSDLTVTDNLGGFLVNGNMVYPLTYTAGSVLLFVNGVLQAEPTVTAGPPMTISGISIPAGGSAVIVYETALTDFAPLTEGASITNTATITGDGITVPVTASETVTAAEGSDLAISKALSPAVVSSGDRLTYTFVITNSGNAAATAEDAIVMTDVFDLILSEIEVTYNGENWSEGTNYTYDLTAGRFATVAGQITVPAASYTQNEDGTWTVTPGTVTLVIEGTVQ